MKSKAFNSVPKIDCHQRKSAICVITTLLPVNFKSRSRINMQIHGSCQLLLDRRASACSLPPTASAQNWMAVWCRFWPYVVIRPGADIRLKPPHVIKHTLAEAAASRPSKRVGERRASAQKAGFETCARVVFPQTHPLKSSTRKPRWVNATA